MRSPSSASPTTATPPTMSEWPFRYLVAECMTMSAPSSSGRCIQGVAKVLSTTTRMPRPRAAATTAAMSTSFSSGLVGVSIQSMRVFGPIAAAAAFGSERSDESEIQTRRAAAHALEQAERAAVEVVHRDDVVAGVEQLEQRRGRRHARREGEAARAALEVGDAALVGEARRVLGARILEALVHAGARLRVGRGRVDRRHHRARGRVGRLTGVDGAGGEAERLLRVLHRCLIASRSSGDAGS